MNTAAKRFSAIALTLPYRGAMVPPSGVVDQGERQAFAFAYSGIPFVGPPIPSSSTKHGSLAIGIGISPSFAMSALFAAADGLLFFRPHLR